MHPITPLICYSFSLAAMCNSVLLEFCCYTVHNAHVTEAGNKNTCHLRVELLCVGHSLRCATCLPVSTCEQALNMHESFPREAVTPSIMTGNRSENLPM